MELIKIGKIVNTHGIKGELRILSKFPYKEKIFIKNMKLYIDKKDIETINTYRKHKNFDMVTFTGYTNINEVLKYKGKNVYVNKEDITLRKEEYLDEDIIGMTVIYNNIEKGIASLNYYSGGKLKEQKLDSVFITNNKYYLIPYNYNLIDKIDITNKKIYIKNISGLFD